MMSGPAKRAEARALGRKPTPQRRKHPAKSEARPRPLNMAKRELLQAPRKGQNCKCDRTPLLRKNRRTRNLSNSARRCEHSAPPSKFFQRNYSFRHERPHFFLNTPGKEHNSTEAVLQMPQFAQSYRREYLTKLGNPKVASPKRWRSQSVCQTPPRATHPGESRETRPRSVHSLREQRASRLRGQVFPLPFATNRIAAES